MGGLAHRAAQPSRREPGGCRRQVAVVVLDTTANRATEAQAMAAHLGQAGINAEVRVWQPSVLLARILAGQRVAYTTDWAALTSIRSTWQCRSM